MAHAHVAAAGIGVGLPGAVGLERQIFGVGLGEAADPVVEGVVGHRVPHGAAEAVAPVPFLALGGRHVGVALDDGVKSLPCIIDGARGDEKPGYRQILAGGDVGAVFPRPVPADPQLFFQKLVAGVEGPHGDEGTPRDHPRGDVGPVAAGKHDRIADAGDEQVFRSQHVRADPVFHSKLRSPHHQRGSGNVFRFRHDGGSVPRRFLEVSLQFGGGVFFDRVRLGRDHDGKENFTFLDQHQRLFRRGRSHLGGEAFGEFRFLFRFGGIRIRLAVADLGQVPHGLFLAHLAESELDVEVVDVVQIGHGEAELHGHGLTVLAVVDLETAGRPELVPRICRTAEGGPQRRGSLAPAHLQLEHHLLVPVLLGVLGEDVEGGVGLSVKRHVLEFGDDLFRREGGETYCRDEQPGENFTYRHDLKLLSFQSK